ncbi:MAG TPA: hypothetical protein VJC20_00435 [Candidatus Paceibacterota bacterium]
MGKDAIERMYAPEILDAVREMPWLVIVSSEKELADWLSKQKRATAPTTESQHQKTASEKILEIAFADS